MNSGSLRLHRLEGIHQVASSDWDRLVGPDQPALRHAFLEALESTGAVGGGTGWLPRHLIVTDENKRLLGALPLYEKQHSFGEFVFDFLWADAWHRSGLRYYPKLVSAIPFTPVDGPRLLIAPKAPTGTRRQLAAGAEALALESGASSVHALFCTGEDGDSLAARDWLQRENCRFVWHNRGYRDFSEWQDTLRAKKRKNLKRERRRVHEAGFRFQIHDGDAIDRVDWDEFYPAYATTYHARGQRPYLPHGFFSGLAARMPESMVVIEARDRTGALAGVAFCLRGSGTLYGRHWGRHPVAGNDLDETGLHFETCYHQGVEYCIDQGLRRFDPGVQGEHKLARGFEPQATRSMHWIPAGRLRESVREFVQMEARHVRAYRDAARDHLPFRREGDGGDA